MLPRKKLATSQLLSIVAVVVSVVSLLVAARAYYVTYRPYVGITGMEHHFLPGPPQMFLWVAHVKNVGSIPAWVQVERSASLLSFRGRVNEFTSKDPAKHLYLMPEQTGKLTGSIWIKSQTANEAGMLKRILLAGEANVEVIIRLTYSSPGLIFGKNSYSYQGQHELKVKPRMAFHQTKAAGD